MERTGYLLTGLPCAIALVLIHVTIFFIVRSKRPDKNNQIVFAP
jgi:hypothetical protein